jgi:hypothetical protein
MAQKTRIMTIDPCRFTNVANSNNTHFKTQKQRKSNFLFLKAINHPKMLIKKLKNREKK